MQRVLIVDDEAMLRTLMADILLRSDFEPVVVENGEEALRVLQKDSDFGLIISDINMPRMDGITLLREVQQRFPGIPVLLTSVHSSGSPIQALLREGEVEYLPRPFTARQLIDAVYTTLEKSR